MKWQINELLGEDITLPATVHTEIHKLPKCDVCELEVDFAGCLIDYPAISLVIDVALNQSATLPGPKHLVVTVDYELGAPILLRWILLGSAVLGLDHHDGIDEAKIRSQLREYCKKQQLTLTVRLVDFANGKRLREDPYGP